MMNMLLLVAVLGQTSPKVGVEFHVIPPGHDTTLEDGKRVRYYLLHEWLQLAAADLQLRKLKEEVALQGQLVLDLKLKGTAQDQQIIELSSMVFACDNQSIRRLTKYKACEKALVKASAPPVWPYLVGIAGSVVGIVGTTIYMVK